MSLSIRDYPPLVTKDGYCCYEMQTIDEHDLIKLTPDCLAIAEIYMARCHGEGAIATIGVSYCPFCGKCISLGIK